MRRGMRDETHKKVERAVRLLRSITPKEGQQIEIAYSGGKDSDVILELARMADIPHKAIYKSTTIDPPGTIMHAVRAGAEIRRPERTFFQLVAMKGLPTRFSRFCCAELKEYPSENYNVVLGVRRDESQKRAKRYNEPVVCRVWNKRKDVRQQFIYPILDWTMADEVDFIHERGICLHPLYYREDGTLDLTRRLGCMCCPLMSERKRIEQFKQHPGIMRLYIKAAQRFLDTHKGGLAWSYYQGSATQMVVHKVLSNSSPDDFESMRDFGTPMNEQDFRNIIVQHFGWEALPKEMR